MKSSTTLKSKITSIAIGGFDGIHLAHQKLIDSLDENGAIVVIEKERSNLTPQFDRKKFVSCEVFIFDINDIKNLNHHEFMNLLKKNFVNLKKIVVGYDFRFGKDRACDAVCLKNLFENVQIIKEIQLNNISIHSKLIKDLIKNGNLIDANKFLNRHYSITGEVIKGQGIGKKELFATINLKVSDYLIPKNGIYASYTKIKNQTFPSVTFIGERESTDNLFSIETHLLDISEVYIADNNIEVEFISFIREKQKFSSKEKLKKTIANDIKKAKGILNVYSKT